MLRQPVPRKVDIKIDFRNDSSAKYIDVNELEMSRTLSNKINNSVKSYENGGTVNVIVTSKNSNLIVIIEDFGSGIDGKYLDKIFE